MIDQVLSGRYKLVRPLGAGGMARVLQAQDLRLGRMVAVKILHTQIASDDTSYLRRFEQEARLAASFVHPNVVGVFDVGQDDDLHYIVMEYVQGETLKELIARRGALPVDQALDIAIQVCSALDAAHQHGLIHRDIKSQNILIGRPTRPGSPASGAPPPLDRYGATRAIPARGQGAPAPTVDLGEGPVLVKVADFGIAHEIAAPSFTATGMVMGSVHYFSPEQARGQAATPRSDLYSVGVVLYEMLTGQLPFQADNQMAVAMQQISQPPVPPGKLNPAVPPAVEAIVLRALAKNADGRYATAPQMMQALTAARRGAADPTTAVRPTPLAPTTAVRTPPLPAPAAPARPAPAAGSRTREAAAMPTRPLIPPPQGTRTYSPGRSGAGRSLMFGIVAGLILLLVIGVAAYTLLPKGSSNGVTTAPTETATVAASTETAQPTDTTAPPTRTPRPRLTSTAQPVIGLPTQTAPPDTATATLQPTVPGVPTETPTPVPTDTPLPTDTTQPTSTPAPTNTSLPTNTVLPTATPVPPTNTAVPPTDTPLPTATMLPTETPTPVPPTSTPLPTAAMLPTETALPTSTPVPADTALPTPTETSVLQNPTSRPAVLVLTPKSAAAGSTVTATGSGWTTGSTVTLSADFSGGTDQLGTSVVGPDGTFQQDFPLPDSASAGTYHIVARDDTGMTQVAVITVTQ